jgi:RHS repeat-associated protein
MTASETASATPKAGAMEKRQSLWKRDSLFGKETVSLRKETTCLLSGPLRNLPNTAPTGFTGGTVDLYQPVSITQNGTALTLDDPVQYVPPPNENLTYDAEPERPAGAETDGALAPPRRGEGAGRRRPNHCNLKTDGRWIYTWDLADRLVKIVSLPFTQPAAGAVPARTVKGLTVEFQYDGFSRHIGKKVSELAPGLPAGTAPTLVKWEAYVYDGWNMVATYQRHLTGTHAGKAQKRLASHVWGPDVASRLEARRDWQAAGGVGGLLMTLYPSSIGLSPTYTNWLYSQGVTPGTAVGYFDYSGSQVWIPYTGGSTPPFYDAGGNYIDTVSGFQTPSGFLPQDVLEEPGYGFGYSPDDYQYAIVDHLIHVPVMDHMGNVTSVVRMSASPGNGSASQPEFLYDYDAFGKEIRSTALLPGSNPDNYPFHYSTKFTDAETGLVYYGYRFYDPANGRWINRDPIEEDGGLNLYGMVGNDGTGSIDVLGNQVLFTPTVTPYAMPRFNFNPGTMDGPPVGPSGPFSPGTPLTPIGPGGTPSSLSDFKRPEPNGFF